MSDEHVGINKAFWDDAADHWARLGERLWALGMSFNRSFEGWIRLFFDIGFRITDYRELYARDTEERDLGHVTAEWAKTYPSEQVWWLEKPAKM